MADLQINTEEITAALKKNLEGFAPSIEQSTVGRVLEVGDGIARVSGLPDCAVNEMLRFENGLIGLALNLDEDSIGAVVLGEAGGIEEGQAVVATGDILSVPVGDGRLVLVADSEFFHNFNLESLERYSVQNIEFVSALLEYVTGRPPP